MSAFAPSLAWDDEMGEFQLRCRACGEWWPVAPEFWPMSQDGAAIRCKACRASARRVVRGRDYGPWSDRYARHKARIAAVPERAERYARQHREAQRRYRERKRAAA